MEGKGDLQTLPPTNPDKWRVVNRLPGASSPKTIQSIKEMQEKAETAFRDALTGLKNDRAFEKDFSERISSGEQCVLVMVDANRLKLINDVFGHGEKSKTIEEENPTGDRFLGQLGIFLASHAKTNIDDAYRLHSDEFAMLLEHMPLDVLEKRLSELTVLANENKDKDPLFPSMSIGVVVVDPAVSKDQSCWVAKADSAMYEAKQTAKKNDPWSDTPSELLSNMMKEALSSATDKKVIGDIYRKYFIVPTTVNIWQEVEK